jgi:hypothetical protein
VRTKRLTIAILWKTVPNADEISPLTEAVGVELAVVLGEVIGDQYSFLPDGTRNFYS